MYFYPCDIIWSYKNEVNIYIFLREDVNDLVASLKKKNGGGTSEEYMLSMPHYLEVHTYVFITTQ